MLYRKITSYIEDYLKSDNDKILILEGARQIGKSFSIREVGTRLFTACPRVTTGYSQINLRQLTTFLLISTFFN